MSARRHRGQVLVVDDEAAIGRALRRVLSDSCDVVAVTSARAALARLLRGERYDIVLCDLMMPEMDGIELHRRLSETNPTEAARIVFITGCALTARVDAFLQRAPNLLLEKPLDLDGLRELIGRRIGAPTSDVPPSSDRASGI